MEIFSQESWEKLGRSRNKNYRILAGRCLQSVGVSIRNPLYTVSESTREELTGTTANRRTAIYKKSQKYSG